MKRLFVLLLIIFSCVNSVNASEPIKLVAVGDVMLARSVGTRMLKYQDWRWPFLQVADEFNQADILFGNLESPIGLSCLPTDEGMKFCADRRSVQGLRYAGFDVLSLANNHMYDQGREAQLNTQILLDQNGIAGAMPYEIAMVEVKNTKLAFIALDDTIAPIDWSQALPAIQQAQDLAEKVIVSLHWGVEYTHQPTLRQRELSKLLIDAGADLIIGHHPHWTQPPELYQNKWIIYSLGNFVFDQMWSEETRLGWVAELEINSQQIALKGLWPVKNFDYGQPRWVSWVQAPLVLE